MLSSGTRFVLNTVEACDNTAAHIIGCVVLPRSASCFSDLQDEFPIPMLYILDHFSRVLLAHTGLCSTPLRAPFRVQPTVCGDGIFYLHCHCDDPGSLRCISGRHILIAFIREVVTGTVYNTHFPWYRQIVNWHAHEFFRYEGSIIYQAVHYIYYRARSANLLHSIVTGLHARHISNFIWGAQNNVFSGAGWIILPCHSCDLTEAAARRCADKAKKFYKRCLQAAGLSVPGSACEDEIRRQQHIRRAIRGGPCGCDVVSTPRAFERGGGYMPM